MKKKGLLTLIAVAVLLAATVVFLRWSPAAEGFLGRLSGDGQWLLPLVTTAALVDSINPCAFSVLLLTIAFLFSLGKIRRQIIRTGLFYIFGILAAYLTIGLGLLQTLYLFNTPHFMAKAGAGIMVFFGLIVLIGEFWPAFPVKLKIPASAHRPMAVLMEKGSIAAAFLLGALVGLVEFPCTGGPYLMVLGLLHDQSTFWSGFGYLLFYNLIFVAPLIVILFIGGDRAVLAKFQVWKKEKTRQLRFGSGLAMVILGIITFLLYF